jgi:hypothetical protein
MINNWNLLTTKLRSGHFHPGVVHKKIKYNVIAAILTADVYLLLPCDAT